jgi:hypothetical protein
VGLKLNGTHQLLAYAAAAAAAADDDDVNLLGDKDILKKHGNFNLC